VTSLHFHFPWLVMANLRWSLFCAATRRPMRLNHDWAPFFEIADSSLPYREKLRQWAGIAHQRYDTVAFSEFCATHLSNLEAVTREFFSTDTARDAVRQKWRRSTRRTRWTRSPSCSGRGSRNGAKARSFRR